MSEEKREPIIYDSCEKAIAENMARIEALEQQYNFFEDFYKKSWNQTILIQTNRETLQELFKERGVLKQFLSCINQYVPFSHRNILDAIERRIPKLEKRLDGSQDTIDKRNINVMSYIDPKYIKKEEVAERLKSFNKAIDNILDLFETINEEKPIILETIHHELKSIHNEFYNYIKELEEI